MFSEVDNPQNSHPLANEASLVAMLGMADQTTSEQTPEIDPEMAVEALLDDPALTQLLIRRQQDGVELITGYYRLPVEAGQQRVSWHVPFVPPMPSVPECTADPVDGSDVRIRFTNVQKFGARAEMILSKLSDSNGSVLITISVESKPS